MRRVSLVRRDGDTLNGVDSTFKRVTFGGNWSTGATVPAGSTVTSDPIPFDLVAGQDVFLTFWAPPRQPTVFLNEGSDTSAWTITGDDQTATIDWSSLSIGDTSTDIYIAERLEVVQGGGPTGPLFSDSFENSEWDGLWIEDSQNDWFRSTQRSTAGTYSAEVDGRATNATLTSGPIDLQGKTNATVTFDWLIEGGFDSGESVAFDISTDGGATWTQKAHLRGNIDPENVWHHETVQLSGLNNLRLRFRATVSGSWEDANIDAIEVTAQ